MLRVVCLFAAAIAAATPAVPAGAGEGCLLCGAGSPATSATAGGTIGGDARPALDIEMTTGFNFRRFRAPGASGDVLVEADGSVAGGPADYALVGNVVIRGAPHSAVAVSLPQSIVLASRRGGRIEIRRLRDSLPKNPRLDANGRLEFSFSAPLELPAGALPGDYRASFSIEAVYD
jgi:hypothetical protein